MWCYVGCLFAGRGVGVEGMQCCDAVLALETMQGQQQRTELTERLSGSWDSAGLESKRRWGRSLTVLVAMMVVAGMCGQGFPELPVAAAPVVAVAVSL